MPRRLRFCSGGFVFHALNRAVGRATLFDKDDDYAAFVNVLQQAQDEVPMRLLAFCLMPNHWHLVVWPGQDGELSRFLHWVTMTHTQRWHAHRHTVGTGPLYQGRLKSFPVQEDDHLLIVLRYVERNPLRAGLVRRAEQWRWSSLWYRAQGETPGWLHAWPLPVPSGWLKHVNASATEAELEAVRRSAARGAPFGDSDWQRRTAEQLGLLSTLRPRGRPRKPRPEPRAKALDPL
jgi:putative transposase